MLFQPLFRPQRGTVSNFQGSEKIPKRPVGLEFDEPSNDKNKCAGLLWEPQVLQLGSYVLWPQMKNLILSPCSCLEVVASFSDVV